MPRPGETKRFLLAFCFLWLASCGPEPPDPGAWHSGPRAEGAIFEVELPPGTSFLSSGTPKYDISGQVLYFPLFIGLQQHIYRFDLRTKMGRWQDKMPPESPVRRDLLRDSRLLGDSSYLRRNGRQPAPQQQPFGAVLITVEQHETRYSRTYYQVGFPLGEYGWVTRDYGDGRLDLYTSTGAGDRTLLLSQDYETDNYSFTAGWSPDGRHVVVLEEVTAASYHEQARGRVPTLRFAVFGPYPVEKTQQQIIDFFVRADEKAHEKQLDRKLAQRLLTPEERYGRFYEELVGRIRSCPAIEKITGPVNTLSLRRERTLGLSNGDGREAGKYFTFDLQGERGNGSLSAAAFYPETPPKTRREIIRKIARYDLAFEGQNHYLENCRIR